MRPGPPGSHALPGGLELQVLFDGQPVSQMRLEPPGPYAIGRAENSTVLILDRQVSREHGTVMCSDGQWLYRDSGSQAGSWIAGQRITTCAVTDGLVLHLGEHTLLAVRTDRRSVGAEREDGKAPDQGPKVATGRSSRDLGTGHASRPGTRVQRIGRAPDNDLVVDALTVSRYQAEIRIGQLGPVLVDLGSRHGTFVDGQRIVAPTLLRPGARVTVGPTTFAVRSGRLTSTEPPQAMAALEADDLVVAVGDAQRILDGVSFALPPSSMLAVVGPTGAGKSTLLKAITGFRPPDEGSVLIDGHDLYANFDELRLRIGYVPQDDILHPQLTIRRALRYGAELRFPAETTVEERDARVEEVMSELGLTERADLQIERLSGGQRKRTSVALELLTKPSLLFLDEPTSGLDPGYEQAVMQLFRSLADAGRAVVVVTHSLASLELCDLILFLAPGGRKAYFGPPASALEHFGLSDFPSVFRSLENSTPAVGSEALRDRRHSDRAQAQEDARSHPAPVDGLRQLSMLVRRQFRILTADTKNLVFLGMAAVIPALLILALVGGGALGSSHVPDKNARTLLGAIVITAAALGAANGLREIVKEQAIYQRERAVGLRRGVYLCSKGVALGTVTAAQCALLTVLATLNAAGPSTSNLLPPRIELIVDVSAVGVSTVVLGLLISALVSSSEKAMALIPVVFVVAWLFSGIAVDLHAKPVLDEVAYLTTSNWGVSASASSVNLPQLEDDACAPHAPSLTSSQGEAPPGVAATLPCDARWKHGIGIWTIDLSALALLTLLFGLGADWALARKEPLESERHRYLIASGLRSMRSRLRPSS